MNKNKQFVITINRELGSGGRTVGRKLAEKLGVPFYDKAPNHVFEQKFHLSVDEIEKLKGRSHIWWTDFKRIVGIGEALNDAKYYVTNVGDEPELLATEEIFKVETEILKGLAEKESCVIAGRSGFHVFRTHPNHLHILIPASIPFRVARVVREQELTPDEALQTIETVDKMRENYVNRYTGSSRYDAHNYSLVIAADGKTEDEIVDIIMKFIG
jgi:cytidylate kinase